MTVFDNIRKFFRREPTSAFLTVLCVIYMAFYGFYLMNVPETSYTKQREFFPIELWSWGFMLSALVLFLTLFAIKRWQITLVFNFFANLVVNLWALTYLAGALEGTSIGTAASAYIFISLVFNYVPLITVLNNHAKA